jgi:hypothetical protein
MGRPIFFARLNPRQPRNSVAREGEHEILDPMDHPAMARALRELEGLRGLARNQPRPCGLSGRVDLS